MLTDQLHPLLVCLRVTPISRFHCAIKLSGHTRYMYLLQYLLQLHVVGDFFFSETYMHWINTIYSSCSSYYFALIMYMYVRAYARFQVIIIHYWYLYRWNLSRLCTELWVVRRVEGVRGWWCGVVECQRCSPPNHWTWVGRRLPQEYQPCKWISTCIIMH